MQRSMLRSLVVLLLLLTDTSVASRSTRAAIKLLGVVDDAISAVLVEKVDGASAQRQPLVTVSYAQTLDGSIAPLERTRLDISSNCSFQLLHSLRARHDAVLIGINTLLFDTPRLNVRMPLPGVKMAVGSRQPRPIVIDSELRLLDAATILLERPIVFTCLRADTEGEAGGAGTGVGTGAGVGVRVDDRWTRAQERVRGLGGDLVTCRPDAQGRCDIAHCMQILYEIFGVRSVLVEGGAGIIQSVLEGGLAHQVVLTLRPCFFGGYRSLTRQLRQPVGMTGMQAASIGGDIVLYGQLEEYQQLLTRAGGSSNVAVGEEGQGAAGAAAAEAQATGSESGSSSRGLCGVEGEVNGVEVVGVGGEAVVGTEGTEETGAGAQGYACALRQRVTFLLDEGEDY